MRVRSKRASARALSRKNWVQAQGRTERESTATVAATRQASRATARVTRAVPMPQADMAVSSPLAANRPRAMTTAR